MIPVSLSISGFLSYKDPAEIDFTSFDLACISGQNGSGKSSILDAMTWSLFGRARKHDESIINIQSETAQVSFTFQYEGNLYRVIRTHSQCENTSFGNIDFSFLFSYITTGLSCVAQPRLLKADVIWCAADNV